MNTEHTNAALARWLGWHLSEDRYWHTDSGWVAPLSNDPTGRSCTYFNPMQRIDHAWLLVEKITAPPTTIEQATTAHNTKFMLWWRKADVWSMSVEEAARAICEAIIEIAEIEV